MPSEYKYHGRLYTAVCRSTPIPFFLHRHLYEQQASQTYGLPSTFVISIMSTLRRPLWVPDGESLCQLWQVMCHREFRSTAYFRPLHAELSAAVSGSQGPFGVVTMKRGQRLKRSTFDIPWKAIPSSMTSMVTRKSHGEPDPEGRCRSR